MKTLEQKIINGKLMYLAHGDSEWRPVTNVIGISVNSLLTLEKKERLNVVSFFCRYCGSDDANCLCAIGNK